MRELVISLFLLFVAGSVFGEQAAADRFKKVADRMVKAINEGDYAGIGKDFAKSMEDFLPLEKRKPFFKDLLVQYGKIRELDVPRLILPGQAVFVAHCERGKLDIKVWLDDKDKIIGLLFLPHTPDIPVPKKHETKLSLPFKDRWRVFWGGDTKELNIHHDAPNQKFAFDFIGVNKDGEMHRDDGKANKDYFAFGREVLAPADGIVTDVINGVRDNLPGSMNPYSALGNAVFIRHREHEVSVLAHLKRGSIKVKADDEVRKGQVVALRGNSWNSSQPHLHYHLQNTPVIQDGVGIKCYFQKMNVVDGDKSELKMNYSPIKGGIVAAE